MNVMNFIKTNKGAQDPSRFNLDRETNEYQKAINRQGSKKLI